jgi:hypothetical protein
VNPSEIIQLHALKLKHMHHRGNSGGPDLIEWAAQQNPEAVNAELRNICALISPGLFSDVERLCNSLDFSKRQFVEMALIEFVDKADAIVREINPLGDA